MLSPRFLRLFFLLAVFFNACAVAGDPHEWLAKMEQAARTMNYQGVFVYHHGNSMQTMQIFHRVDNGKAQERLFSLNGSPREVIRTDDEVRCYLPEDNSILVEHRRAGNKGFPSILPERIGELDANYAMELARAGRVADREAQRIIVRPKDEYRYGYQLWADSATGLLLRADLLDAEGKMVERFIFTSIKTGIGIPDAELKPRLGNKSAVLYSGESEGGGKAPAWEAQLPPGFKLTNYINRRMPKGQKAIEHLVYSDGLAAVSVFIEKADPQPAVKGPNRMGAVHAYAKVVDGQQVTVVGEVPAITVEMIGASVRSTQSNQAR